MEEAMELTSAEQIQALAHPLRQRLLRVLATEQLTNRQLADRLGVAPGHLHFHVRMLERAGLIRVVKKRPKGGVIEKYYQPVAMRFVAAFPLTSAAAGEPDVVLATLAAVEQEYRVARSAFGGPLPGLEIGHEQARVSVARHERIRELLKHIEEEFRAAADEAASPGNGVEIVATWLVHQIPIVSASGQQGNDVSHSQHAGDVGHDQAED